jgi:predicted lipid-binding transport protein (Tim44 family)
VPARSPAGPLALVPQRRFPFPVVGAWSYAAAYASGRAAPSHRGEWGPGPLAGGLVAGGLPPARTDSAGAGSC